MTDYNSQGSYHTARNLSDLGEEYRQLLGGNISEGNMSQGTDKNANKNLRWTQVMTVEQYAAAGLIEGKLDEDVDEPWEEIKEMQKEINEAWAPLFNPKDYEKPDVSKDISDYILKTNELEERAKQVVQLREHVK